MGATGHLFSGNRDISLSGNRDISLSGNRTTYPLGIGPLIIWDPLVLWNSGHPLGNGTWETGNAILWDSDHFSCGKHPLGIGNLWDEVEGFFYSLQKKKRFFCTSQIHHTNIFKSRFAQGKQIKLLCEQFIDILYTISDEHSVKQMDYPPERDSFKPGRKGTFLS